MSNKPKLRIYCFSQPHQTTEWYSLLGDKYLEALDFKVELVDRPEAADVIAWDGVISPKASETCLVLTKMLKEGKTLLLQGEAKTLLKDNPFMSQIDLDSTNYFDLTGWTVLPEEMLTVLQKCHQKTKHG